MISSQPSRHAAITGLVLLTLSCAGSATDSGGGELDLIRWDMVDGARPEVLDVETAGDAADGGDPLPDVVSCEPGAAGFGCRCEGNGDCASGYCVYHNGDRVCTRGCVDVCPAGWACQAVDQGADPVFICLSRFAHLCLPCETSDDCRLLFGGGDTCVGYGDETGSFCGAACADDAPCPDGYACAEATSVEGQATRQCVRASGDCACSDAAVTAALTTPCAQANEWGRCTGRRLCDGPTPSACDAPIPQEEICFNGIDDDCDGETDPWEPCHPCVCGDGACEPDRCDEHWEPALDPPQLTCAVDCTVCGNGSCDPGEGVSGELACVVDCCGSCGDGACKGFECGEDPASCPLDCGAWTCGDGTCNPGENAVDCPVDCVAYACGNHTCEPTEDPDTCPEDCDVGCGDCACHPSESYASCPVDCGFCDDGYCSNCVYLGESLETCPSDCHCVPDCEGKVCGPDLCGGLCGQCDDADPCAGACVDGACVPALALELACDGQDEDCDGQADEDFLYEGAGLGAPCGGLGVCGGGVVECSLDGARATCSTNPDGSASESGPEICDYLDNDCDGLTDEDFTLVLLDGTELTGSDQPCGAGICTNGLSACAPEGDAVLCPSEAIARLEACDGLDDDCDGLTDEDYPGLGEPCDGGDDDQCAGGVYTCTVDGNTLFCADDEPVLETCDGDDDDCDALVDDEDPDLITVACALQIGACAGSRALPARCVDGAWEPCGDDDYQAHSPVFDAGAEARCDGVDNDCDGLTDEDVSCTDSDPCTLDDHCHDGACVGTPYPPDAGPTCTTSLCESATGAVTLVVDDHACLIPGAGDALVCVAADGVNPANPCERCLPGLDDQGWSDAEEGATCNDLDPWTVWDQCTSGACTGTPDRDMDGALNDDDCCPEVANAGQEDLDGDGAGDVCDSDADADGVPNVADCGWLAPTVFPGGTEVCDGLDNDCNGLTDDADLGLVRPACPLQQGVCTSSVAPSSRCVDGAWGSCQPEDYLAWSASYEAEPELTCDGLDNDCDGDTDEALTAAPGDCKLVGVCTTDNVISSCAAGTWVCDYGGVPDYDGDLEQRCDGLDNDCDGDTDEGFEDTDGDQIADCVDSDVDGDLWTDDVDCAPFDAQVHPGATEDCDGVDDDCDGQIDEDFAAGAPCGVGVCAGGLTECMPTGDATRCASMPGGSGDMSGTETCNQLDDDCDGDTDEGFDVDGLCGTGACAGGQVECAPDGSARCSTMPGGSMAIAITEACNGYDDDCDGLTDEGFNLGAYCGDGLCGGGQIECDALGIEDTRCSTMPGGTADKSKAETCNYLDDDCDGDTDDGVKTTFFRDQDYDDFGDPADTMSGCSAAVGYIAVGQDCDDTRSTTNPDASEACNYRDDDCDGQTDEGVKTTYYRDQDGDGYGRSSDARQDCSAPSGYVASSTDCNDNDNAINPGEDEACNQIDDDCNGQTDENPDQICPETWELCESGECHRFVNNGDGTITDRRYGNEWEFSRQYGVTWSQAIDYCAGIPLDGGGWHLPTVDELRTWLIGCPQNELDGACEIHDACDSQDCTNWCGGCDGLAGPGWYGCYYDEAFDPGVSYYYQDRFEYYWTATEYFPDTANAYYMEFSYGYIDRAGKNNQNFVRCVR